MSLEKHGTSSVVPQTCQKCGQFTTVLHKVGSAQTEQLVCDKCLKELVPTTPEKVTGGPAT